MWVVAHVLLPGQRRVGGEPLHPLSPPEPRPLSAPPRCNPVRGRSVGPCVALVQSALSVGMYVLCGRGDERGHTGSMAEEGGVYEPEELGTRLLALSGRYSSEELRADSGAFCADFCEVRSRGRSGCPGPLSKRLSGCAGRLPSPRRARSAASVSSQPRNRGANDPQSTQTTTNPRNAF